LTIADLGQRYLDEHARPKKKPSSVKADLCNLKNHILPALGRREIADVSRADVARLHHSMRETPGGANRTLALLSKMFNLAERWGLRPDGTNPCRHVERYRERKLERFLSDEELARLGKALERAERDGLASRSGVAAMRLLIFTGCRSSEILGLRWEHVDQQRRLLRLPDSKTGARIVPINAPALAVLSQLEGNGLPWVLPGRRDGSHLVNLSKPWDSIRKLAHLEGLRLHDLRHSFASVGASTGLGLPTIGRLLGHTQAATTQRYAHLADDPLRKASEAIAAHLEKAMKGTGPLSS
jgi:integrase